MATTIGEPVLDRVAMVFRQPGRSRCGTMLWPGHPATNLFRWGDGTPKPTIALASSDPFTRGTVADVDSYNYADPS